MYEAGDIDPSYPLLRYICDRFELNEEQRFWLAFLYACTYCGPTVFYIYNEFPDFETLQQGRLEAWWKANKLKTVFQTDRKWMKLSDGFPEAVESYTRLLRGRPQSEAFRELKGATPEETYDKAFAYFSQVKHFGRFSMFLYLEAVFVVTGFKMEPTGLNLKDADTCREGLCRALALDEMAERKLTPKEVSFLQGRMASLVQHMKQLWPERRTDWWNVETTLCAFKKLRQGKRYVGYYLDRQADEIVKLEKLVDNGVDWSVLWDFRVHTFKMALLVEAKL